jgi:hypothetical protein
VSTNKRTSGNQGGKKHHKPPLQSKNQQITTPPVSVESTPVVTAPPPSVASRSRVSLTLKEVLLLIVASALAIGSLKGDDPWIVLPMLGVSAAAFVVLCVIHEGRRLYRIGVAVSLICVLSLIASRLFLWPSRIEAEHAKERMTTTPEAKATVIQSAATTVVNVIPGSKGLIGMTAEAIVTISNGGANKLENIDKFIRMPVIETVSFDDPGKIFLVSGGKGSDFVNVHIPELSPADRRIITIRFQKPQSYSTPTEWAKAYGLPEDVVVTGGTHVVGPVYEAQPNGPALPLFRHNLVLGFNEAGIRWLDGRDRARGLLRLTNTGAESVLETSLRISTIVVLHVDEDEQRVRETAAHLSDVPLVIQDDLYRPPRMSVTIDPKDHYTFCVFDASKANGLYITHAMRIAQPVPGGSQTAYLESVNGHLPYGSYRIVVSTHGRNMIPRSFIYEVSVSKDSLTVTGKKS